MLMHARSYRNVRLFSDSITFLHDETFSKILAEMCHYLEMAYILFMNKTFSNIPVSFQPVSS